MVRYPLYQGTQVTDQSYSPERGMVVAQVVSKIWGKYVINLFADEQNWTEIVETATLYLLHYLRNYGKQNDNENYELPEWLMNVVHNEGIIIEDTEDNL